MTKAADPIFGSAASWGSWPVLLDRIPRRMRTQCTATSRSDTGLVGELLVARVLLPDVFGLASHLDAIAEQVGLVPLRPARHIGQGGLRHERQGCLLQQLGLGSADVAAAATE